MSKQIKWTPKMLFLCISWFGILSFFFYALGSNGHGMLWLLQENNPEIFGVDYFTHVYFGMVPSQLYERTGVVAGCFPPLAYIMYYACYLLSNPGVDVPIEYFTTFYEIKSYLFIYALFLLLVGFLLYYAVRLVLKEEKHVNCIFFALFLSAPLIGSGFFVGNSTMIVLGLLIIALYLKDAKTKKAREIALLLIALCAGLKIYPAIFGLLYLKEKRWLEAMRLTLYGIACFLIPFIWFGGIRGFLLWGYHILATMKILDLGRIQYLKGMIYSLLVFISGRESGLYTAIASICSIIFLLLMFVLAWFSKEKYRSIFFLTAAMVFFPSNSFRYTLGYFIIPFVFWLKENRTGKIDWIQAILYGCLYTIPTWWGFLTGFKLDYGYFTLTYVEAWVYTVAYLLTFIMIGYELYLLMKNKSAKHA